MIGKTISSVITTLLLISIGMTGCGKSDASKTAASDSAGPAASGVELEAQNAAMAEIQKHWTKAADGWITARESGSPTAPDHFLRQIREIQIDSITADPLTDSDHLNNVDWSGQITFKPLACREAGDPGMLLDGLADISPTRQHGQWTAWAQYQPELLRLQKVKGQWQVSDDTWILRGTIPTAGDYQRAGVK
jgi:hypothetical protein